jgi:FKBP-type peptidyl-prolyl cis-trans isomerase
MKKVSFAVIMASCLSVALGQGKPAAQPAAQPVLDAKPSAFKNERDKVSYALGLNMGNYIKRQDFDPNIDEIVKAIKGAIEGKPPLLDEAEMRTTMMNWQKAQKEIGDARRKEEGAKYLAENKAKEGVKVTATGLQYKVINPGEGAQPTTNDIATVHYRGTLVNGTEFDSSFKRNKPAEFPITGVIKGWTEALLMMKKGAKWQLTIPSELAYGERGNPSIPGHSVLNFDVELLDFRARPTPSAPPPTPTPPNAAGGQPVVTSDIIKVPSAEGLKKGEKIEVIKAGDLEKLQKEADAKKKDAPEKK